jgi:uncharacterized protein DUF4157
MQKQGPTTSAKPTLTHLPWGMIQRKCECGGSAGMSGECEGCQEKRLTINRYSTDRLAPSSLSPSPAELARSTPLSDSGGARSGPGHDFGRLRVSAAVTGGTSGERAVSRPGDRSEVEADRAAERVMRALSSPLYEEKQEAPEATDLSSTPPLIQREVADENASGMETTPETSTESETAAPEETSAGGLIVEDDAQEVGPGQMRKSDFLAQLNAEIYTAAEEILATRGRTAESCPYITNWFEYGHMRSGSYVETFVRRFTPGSDRVASAGEYIPLAVERVRRSLLVWANTGEITGVPEILAGELPATRQKGAVASLGAQVGAEGEEAAAGALQAKARDGGLAGDSDPRAVQNQLRSGEPLDGGAKTRMESAFGYDFSRVRIHHGANAARLSTGLNARAFTIGSDIAFGAGEYRPGTLVGDAILAHELAHVVQQGGASASKEPLQKGQTRYGALEDDADNAAVGAVVSLWGGAKGKLGEISKNALPRLKSGLRLQRCEDCGRGRAQERARDAGAEAGSDAGTSPTGPGKKGVTDADGKGWLMTKVDSVGDWSLPQFLKVNHTSRTNGRDKFTILEGKFKDKTGSVKQKSATDSYLASGMTYKEAAKVKFNKTSGKLDFGSTTGIAAITDTGNPLPDGTHDIEIPDEPHPGGAGYESEATFAKTWFRIGHSGDRYIHTGRVSAGCATVTDRANWDNIYNYLINSRADDQSVGKIEVKS